MEQQEKLREGINERPDARGTLRERSSSEYQKRSSVVNRKLTDAFRRLREISRVGALGSSSGLLNRRLASFRVADDPLRAGRLAPAAVGRFGSIAGEKGCYRQQSSGSARPHHGKYVLSGFRMPHVMPWMAGAKVAEAVAACVPGSITRVDCGTFIRRKRRPPPGS